MSLCSPNSLAIVVLELLSATQRHFPTEVRDNRRTLMSPGSTLQPPCKPYDKGRLIVDPNQWQQLNPFNDNDVDIAVVANQIAKYD